MRARKFGEKWRARAGKLLCEFGGMCVRADYAMVFELRAHAERIIKRMYVGNMKCLLIGQECLGRVFSVESASISKEAELISP